MPATATSSTHSPTAAADAGRPPRARLTLASAGPLVALVLLMACPALALQLGGPWALAAMLPVCAALAWRLRAQGAAPADAASESAERAEPATGRTSAGRLAVQVVPVWQRNVDAAKDHSEQSMAQLLESFSGVAGHLDKALNQAQSGLQLDLGAVDLLLEQNKAHIDSLTALTRTATGLERDMARELMGFGKALQDMALLTRDVQNIGRATHLLALNTSAEATSAGAASSGFMVVAKEVRDLAGLSREAGIRMARHVSTMQAGLADLARRHQRENLDDEEEVELKAEQAARSVVMGILNSMGSVTQTSRELRQAGAQVQGDLEKIFVSLQSQDRLSQMLTAVTSDMSRYSAWLGGAPDPDAESPVTWLDRLERSYPMEEMRSSHHGTTVVEKSSTVEFF